MNNERYRHELKYIVSEAELCALRARIKGILRPDPHADATGRYQVRSIYFDDLENSAYYENENGVAVRSKWRIRCYNGSDEVISLENKRKDAAMTQKLSCALTRRQFDGIMDAAGTSKAAALLRDAHQNDPVLNRFLTELATKPLKQRVIVQYEREPYFFPSGNVRVTFDRLITSSKAYDAFFSGELKGRPVMPAGRQMMEVKYDDYLPDHIYHAIQLRSMRIETFSKYYLSRRYAG